MKKEVFKNVDQLSQHGADLLMKLINEHVAQKDHCNLCLAGGNSYRSIYEIIAEYEEEVAWDKVHFFWGDERCVPITHEDSNAAMAYDTLLNEIPVSSRQIHIMHGEKAPEEAVKQYRAVLDQYFTEEAGMDIVLLGLGDDGHTASLFPGTAVLDEKQERVSGVYVPKLDTYRITLTAPFLNRSQHTIFVAYGKKKANAVQQVLEGAEDFQQYPAQLIKPQDGEVFWLLDEDAATSLKQLI